MTDTNPALSYVLPPTVARCLEARPRIKGIFGPVATGKTVGVCLYVYSHCRHFAALFPGQTIRWAFVRGTYESTKATTLKSWRETLPDPYFGRWNEAKKTYTLRLPKGQRAEALFLGLDDDADLKNLLSMDLTGFVLEEPAGGIDLTGRVQPGIPETVYDALLTRRRHPAPMPDEHKPGIVLGNPGSKAHWTHRKLKVRAEREPDVVACVDVPASEAPILKYNPNFYDTLAAELGGWDTPHARRYLRGEWLPALAGGFEWSMIPEVAREQLPRFTRIVATCDPATGAVQGDFSVVCVAGLEQDLTATVLDLRVDRFPPEVLIAHIYDVVVRYGLSVFGFEAVAFQAWLETLLWQERERTGSPYRDVVVPSHKLDRDSRIAKEQRIQNALGFRLADRRLKRVAGIDPRALAEWQAELELFPDGDHDDVLDALADLDQVQMIGATDGLALIGPRPPSTPEELEAADRARREASAQLVKDAIATRGAFVPGDFAGSGGHLR